MVDIVMFMLFVSFLSVTVFVLFRCHCFPVPGGVTSFSTGQAYFWLRGHVQKDLTWFASARSLLPCYFLLCCFLSLSSCLALSCLCSVAYVPRGYGVNVHYY